MLLFNYPHNMGGAVYCILHTISATVHIGCESFPYSCYLSFALHFHLLMQTPPVLLLQNHPPLEWSCSLLLPVTKVVLLLLVLQRYESCNVYNTGTHGCLLVFTELPFNESPKMQIVFVSFSLETSFLMLRHLAT